METKNSIRKKILALRDGMPDDERLLFSKNITDALLKMEQIQQAENILCFAGYKSEVSTTELIVSLLNRDKRVFLPRVDGDEMEFYRIQGLQDFEEGYKGILEPSMSCTEVFRGPVSKETVMLMPGAVFAKDGSRIGYGKGFYDRYLAKHDIMNRIALCFSSQLLESIPSDAHDKKASVIVTEAGITECRKV